MIGRGEPVSRDGVTRFRATCRFSGALGCVVLASCSDTAQPRPSSDTIGYIASVRGIWTVGEDTVALGRAVLSTDTIRATADAARTGELGVVLSDGRNLRLLCELPGDCAHPLVPGDSVRDRSVGDRASLIVEAVATAIRDVPGRYESLISRGESGGPTEVVLVLERDGLRPEPLLASLPAGSYGASAWRLAPTEADEPHRFAIDWSPDVASAVPNPPPPGLYEIAIRDELGGSSIDAWVLILPPHEYGEASAAFAEAEAITESWGPASWSQARMFLRAYLDVLAKETR